MRVGKRASEKKAKVEEVYEVERIVDFRIEDGDEQFRIKWKGYPFSDNTWEPVDVVDAPILVKQFWDDHPLLKPGSKKAVGSSSRAADSQESPSKRQKTTPAKNGKSTSQASSSNKKKNTDSKSDSAQKKGTSNGGDTDDYLEKVYLSSDALTAEMCAKSSWEDDVEDIETMEASSTGEDDLALANAKCPQKIIKFYESHLKFG
ncbi:hypothetical protein BASA83_007778 [Batrachochytrium salamandrivorans]|nr:hypothetical protein BASA83_007778 [Batrachochytrium salamandrivorans]